MSSGNLNRRRSVGTGDVESTHRDYVYDDAERLIAVVQKHAGTRANVAKTEFVYDGLSRLRVTKEYTWNGTNWVLTSGSEKRRVYDGMDVVQERDGSNIADLIERIDMHDGVLIGKEIANQCYIVLPTTVRAEAKSFCSLSLCFFYCAV